MLVLKVKIKSKSQIKIGKNQVKMPKKSGKSGPPEVQISSSTRDALVGSAGARPKKENLLRTLLCLEISATAHQKSASDTRTLRAGTATYILVPTLNALKKLRAKTGAEPPKRVYSAPYKGIVISDPRGSLF